MLTSNKFNLQNKLTMNKKCTLMALEKIETLTSIKTSDGLVVTNKLVTSSNGDLETYYFSSLYTTNFTEPLSYQDSAFLKLPKFP